jgi:hypothetical protein
MEKFGTDTKAKALTLETLAAELAALQGRANSLIVFDASVLVSAAMDADGTSYQAPRKARVTDVLAMSQTGFRRVVGRPASSQATSSMRQCFIVQSTQFDAVLPSCLQLAGFGRASGSGHFKVTKS